VVLAFQLVTCLLEFSNKSAVSSTSFGAIDDATLVEPSFVKCIEPNVIQAVRTFDVDRLFASEVAIHSN
jgi:hypothetical protein